MMPSMNPKQMERMMKQMGIKNTQLEAKRVVIEGDGGRVVIDNPQVTMIEMGGQKTFQIMGEAREEKDDDNSEEDIKVVMEKTGKSKEEAQRALEETDGDIAEAILKLQ